MIPIISLETWESYKERARLTALYPKDVGLAYVALGAAGELAELREALQWWRRQRFLANVLNAWSMLRGRPVAFTAATHKCVLELGDLAWYFAMVCVEMRITPKLLASHALLQHMRPIDALTYTVEHLCQCVKRIYRDTDRKTIPDAKANEIKDVVSAGILILHTIANEVGVYFDDVLEANIAKLADRQRRNAIKGEGDTR